MNFNVLHPAARPARFARLAAASALLLLAAAAPADSRTFGRDDVSLTVSTEPERLSLDRDLLVTLELSYPTGVSVALPPLDDRFEGFRVEGSYEGEALSAAGVERRSLHVRARPVPGAEAYRIAPFAVTYSRVRGAAAATNAEPSLAAQWFPTRPIAFDPPVLAAGEGAAPDSVSVSLEPIPIRPSARRLLAAVLCALGGAAALAALVWAARRIHRSIRVARLSPRERALHELDELLARDLPGRGRVKEFYVALTFIVRRYIERRHAIRAPRLTTEEFLAEAVRHPAFSGESLARLRSFLVDADRVKFAGRAATPDDVSASVSSARAYLDAEPPDAARGEGGRS